MREEFPTTRYCWREHRCSTGLASAWAVAVGFAALLTAALAARLLAAPAAAVVADGGWHALPGLGRTHSQPIGIFIPPGKDTQYANSVGVVILGADEKAYYQNYSLASESWDGSWHPLNVQTPTPPHTFMSGAWEILVRDPKTGNQLHSINSASGWTPWKDEGATDPPWGSPTETEDGQGRLWTFRRGPNDTVEYRCLPRDARPPALELQVGHLGGAYCVAFSPDGKTLASGGTDRKIILWDVVTGVAQRILVGHTGEISSLAWSPDGATLISGSPGDGTIRFWNPRTGEWVRTLNGPAGAVALSPDGKRLAGGDGDTVRLWDAQTCAELQQLTGHLGSVRSLAFSPDGQRLAVGSREWRQLGSGELKLWDVPTSVVRWSVTLPEPTYGVTAVAFSPDGQMIASGGGEGEISSDLRLWDARTGALQRVLPLNRGLVTSLLFSPDGQRLVSGAFADKARCWDAHTGALLETFEDEYAGGSFVFGVALSSDGRHLAVADNLGEVTLWDAPTRKLRRRLGCNGYVGAVACSPDGRLIASGTWVHFGVRVWDAQTGAAVWTPGGQGGPVPGATMLTFSRDGALLVKSQFDGFVKLWNVKTKAAPLTFQGSPLYPWVALSPDGKLLAFAGPGKEISVWDVATGEQVHALRGHDGPDQVPGRGTDWLQAAFSPDGKLLATGYGGDEESKPTEIWLWDARTWQRLRPLNGLRGPVQTLTFSPDSTTLAVGNWSGLWLWDVQTGEPRRRLQSGSDWPAAFSPDGTLLATTRGPEIRLWQASTGTPVRILRGHTDYIRDVAFTADGQRLVSGAADHTARVWEVSTGRLLATLLTLPSSRPDEVSSDWVAITPEGYYDASPGAARQIQWRIGADLFPVEAYEQSLHRPDLLRRTLAREVIAETPQLQRFVAGQVIPPQVSITRPRDGQIISGSTVRVEVTVTDDRSDVRVEIRINGRPAATRPITVGSKPIRVDAKPIRVGAKSISLEGKPLPARARPIVVGAKPLPGTHRFAHQLVAEVPLPPGESQVTLKAIATDGDALQGWDELHVQRTLAPKAGAPEATRGDLYVLAIGVGRYQRPRYNLRYAAADAAAFAGLWKRMEGGLYRRVHVTALTDAQATAANARIALLRVLESATLKDSVVLFLAGHGLQTGHGEFYFATPGLDASSPERLKQTALPWRAFEKTLANVDAKRVTLFLDVCHAGSVLGESQASSERLAEALARHGNVLVFASSRAGELSYEDAARQHGAFTAALVEGIGGAKADLAIGARGDGKITAEELLAYLRTRVPQLTRNRQTPTVPLLYDFGEQFLLAQAR